MKGHINQKQKKVAKRDQQSDKSCMGEIHCFMLTLKPLVAIHPVPPVVTLSGESPPLTHHRLHPTLCSGRATMSKVHATNKDIDSIWDQT